MLYLGNEFAPVFDSDLAADGDLPRMKSEVVGDTLGRRRGAWPPSPLPPRTPLPPPPPPPPTRFPAPPTSDPASIKLESLWLPLMKPATSLSATKSSGPPVKKHLMSCGGHVRCELIILITVRSA